MACFNNLWNYLFDQPAFWLLEGGIPKIVVHVVPDDSFACPSGCINTISQSSAL